MLIRFKAGDEAALGDLYERYRGPVFAAALSILGDRGLAADASQQTFLKAWQKADTFDPDRSFGPWIYAIARRTAIDIIRKSRGVTHVPFEEDAVADDRSSGLEAAWVRFEIRLAIEQLPIEEQDVVRMTHLLGLTHAQAAETLGVAVGTVKSRSHRAHRRLAVALQHLLEETENHDTEPVRREGQR